MGLLDNKRQDIYYTGGSQVFYQAPALLSSSNNQFNITNLEFEFGSKITTSDIRVYIESGDEDFTDIEVLDGSIASCLVIFLGWGFLELGGGGATDAISSFLNFF